MALFTDWGKTQTSKTSKPTTAKTSLFTDWGKPQKGSTVTPFANYNQVLEKQANPKPQQSKPEPKKNDFLGDVGKYISESAQGLTLMAKEATKKVAASIPTTKQREQVKQQLKDQGYLGQAKEAFDNVTKAGNKVGEFIGKKLQQVPDPNLGTKGKDIFKTTNTEEQIVNFISNFPSSIARSWGQSLETVSTERGRQKLMEDAKNLPKTIGEVKTAIANKDWQKAMETAFSNSAFTVALDATDFIPAVGLTKKGVTSGIKNFAKNRQTAKTIVKEALEEVEKPVMKAGGLPKEVKNGTQKVSIKTKVPEVKQTQVPKSEKPQVQASGQNKDLLNKYLETPKNSVEQANKDYVLNNYPKVSKKYDALVTKKYGTPNFIGADDAKEVLPGYKGSNAPDYHEASSAIAKAKYAEKLAANKGKGNNTVVFTAGGTGVGKTSALRAVGTDLKEFPVIYDTNLSGLESSSRKIRQALDNGYKVEINFVTRDPVASFESGVLPRANRTGRVVSIDEHIARHKEAYKTLLDLQKKFGDKIDIKVFDNNGQNPKAIDLSSLKSYNYSDAELKSILQQKVRASLNQGQITPEQANATLSSRALVPERPPQSIPTSTTKPSALGLRVEQTAIEKKLTDELSTLPVYETINMKDQASRVADLISKDPQKAWDIALGKEEPPSGVLKESVFKGVEASVTTPEQAIQLAHSPLVSEATALGQRIKALDVKTTDSPVENIKQVIDARAKTIEKKLGTTVKQATDNTIKEIKAKVKVPNRYDWNTFIDSIKC